VSPRVVVTAVVTQEGGYDLATVGACAAAFLAALGGEAGRPPSGGG